MILTSYDEAIHVYRGHQLTQSIHLNDYAPNYVIKGNTLYLGSFGKVNIFEIDNANKN